MTQKGVGHLAILFVDLNGFKETNDTFGHDVGDIVLSHFADVLRKTTRKRTWRHWRRRSDLLARIGGDEFAILLPDTDASGAKRITQFIEAEAAHFSIPVGNGQIVHAKPSIGIAQATHEMTRVEDLLKIADAEMYKVKQQKGRRP